MATTPIIVSLPAGRSGDKLELYPVEGTAIANGAGGDTLTELFSGSRLYKADVTEAITGDHQAVIKTSGGSVFAGGYVLGLTDTTDRQYVVDEAPTLPAEIASAVWDEIITGAEHNINTSAAKFLREASQTTTGVTGTLQSATATTVVLKSGGVGADDIFNGERISIIDGTGAGQSRLISDSVASTDTVTLFYAWTVTPDNTSVYSIQGAEVDVRAVAEQAVTATESIDFDTINDGGTVVLPASATVPSRGTTDTIVLYEGETITQSITITDANGDAQDMSGKTLAVEVEDLSGTDVSTVANGSITRSGASNQTLSFAWPSAVTDTVRSLRYAIRDAASPRTVYASGRIEIRDTTEAD